MSIPLCGLTQQYLNLKVEIDAAMQSVASEGRYILGPNVKSLEREFAAYCGCARAVGVASGTDAIHLALRALDIGPGDEVITTPFTFIATTEAIRFVGATPVFVDIDRQTYNLDVSLVEQAITSRTRAILPVHLYGQPCQMDTLVEVAERHGLAIVEDCAQAVGARYQGQKTGSFGVAGCFSFFPSKNLGAFGDGGMVVTNDPCLFERVEMLRRHGGRVKYFHEELGLNSRLDELQAAVLRVKFKHLDRWNSARRQHASAYNAMLSGIPSVACPAELRSDGTAIPVSVNADTVPSNADFATERTAWDTRVHHVYHQYTIAVEQREHLAQRLKQRNIGSAVYYPVPLHLQEANADLGYSEGSFPVAERAARRCLSLPMFPELRIEQQEEVVARLREILSEGGRLRKSA